jgi:hypothetical protein
MHFTSHTGGYRDPKGGSTMMKSTKMKRMVLTGAAVMVMMSFAATPAMAEGEQQQRPPAPVVGDPGENPIADPGKPVQDPVADSVKDPVADPVEDPVRNPGGIRLCDIAPPGCQNTEEEEEKKAEEEDDSVVCAAIYRLEDGECVPLDDADDNPKPGISIHCRPGFKLVKGDDPSGRGDQCAPMDEEASAPWVGEVSGETTTTAQENDASTQKPVSASTKAGQIANSPTTYGCPYDYEYDEEYDACLPSSEAFTGGFADVVLGDAPWPDSAGGYVGLVGGFGKDTLTAVGAGLTIGLGHYVGDTLVEFGKDGGPIGWGIQGLGYTLGFTGDALGVLAGGAGEIVGAATDVVGAAVDVIGDAAKDAWDEISSWF